MKRKTKQQREREAVRETVEEAAARNREIREIQELELQVCLIGAGACGPGWIGSVRDGGSFNQAEFARFLGALELVFWSQETQEDAGDGSFLFQFCWLTEHYSSVGDIARFFHQNGVRALKELP